MDTAFLDSNAVIKLYHPERGLVWLRSFVSSKNIAVSELVLNECATILGRLYRDGYYGRNAANFVYSQIKLDYNSFEAIKLDVSLLQGDVADLALPASLPATGNKFYVKALDAIQLASARAAHQIALNQDPAAAFIFVTADNQLLKVAAAQGFAVENPESYA